MFSCTEECGNSAGAEWDSRNANIPQKMLCLATTEDAFMDTDDERCPKDKQRPHNAGKRMGNLQASFLEASSAASAHAL